MILPSGVILPLRLPGGAIVDLESMKGCTVQTETVFRNGLVWNRHSEISVPRACAMYTGWCPLAKHVPPLDRSRSGGDPSCAETREQCKALQPT